MLKKFPWLKKGLVAKSTTAKSSTPSSVEVDVDDALPAASSDAPLTDDNLNEVFAAMENTRRDLAADADVNPGRAFFKLAPLKGNWTIANKGTTCDAIQGKASGKKAEAWCAKYSMTKSARFECHMYGVNEATTMATAWCDKMGYMYGVWLMSEDPEYSYSAEDLSAWEAPRAFAELMGGMEGKQLARAHWVMALLPSR